MFLSTNSFINASWGADDRIVYAQSGKGIMRISANGGTPEEILKAEVEKIVSPQILPDGKTILFTFLTRQLRQVVVQSLKSPLWSPNGRELFYLSNDSAHGGCRGNGADL